MTPEAKLRPAGLSAPKEVLLLWGVSFGAILAAYLVSANLAKLVATAGFLYLPLWAMRRRGEDYRDYGLSLASWRADLRLYLIVCAVVLPPFFLAFAAWGPLLEHLPREWARAISPLGGIGHFHPKLPNRFAEWVVDQLLVVALPEEFFYRGYVQARLRDAWPRGRILLGARLGPAFFATAALFALGHLAIFRVWRLAVFFPALLFGWMRERTGSIAGCTLLHATFNLFELWLEASFYGTL